MRIYTRTGDKGETGLFGGERTNKAYDPRIQVIGELDELNAAIALEDNLPIFPSSDLGIGQAIREIQSDLFLIGAITAGANYTFGGDATKRLEAWIDELERAMPVLRNFILPSGTSAARHLHFARAVARRLERTYFALDDVGFFVEEIGVYLNRLSDFLFVAARYANFVRRVREEIWQMRPRNHTETRS